MESTSIKTTSSSVEIRQIEAIFAAQQRQALTPPTIGERLEKIHKIQKWIHQNLEKVQDAMYQDYKKPASEAIVGEIASVVNEISHTSKHLNHWAKPEKVTPSLTVIGTNSYIQYEPKGVCLIISPWNYPFNLAIKPLISCLAAGNTAILKPSELSPNTATVIREMVEELFDPKEVAVFEGGIETSQALLSLPFNHIFFTGSPRVGKIVMAAAARHLASVTLELGGKSPAIVDKSANVKDAAQKIAWGKFLNNGQTCIAPDYVLVHSGVKHKFLEEFEGAIQKMYNPNRDGIQASPDYCRIVNNDHFNRLVGLLEDAIQKGARLSIGGKTDAADRFIEPTALTHLTDEMDIMHEEIFGPILPVVEYDTDEDALAFILNRPKPLASYIFTRTNRVKDFFLSRTSAGGTVVNDTLIHYSHANLPFGGVNNSGIGKSGGHFAFLEFSNWRSVVEQKFGTLKPLYPPYTPTVQKIIKTLIHWL